jgi:hypothetical protein
MEEESGEAVLNSNVDICIEETWSEMSKGKVQSWERS